jgi:hypothetical protein
MAKIDIKNSTFSRSGKAVHIGDGRDVDVTIDSSVFDRVDEVVHMEGVQSLAKKLGVPEVPSEHLVAFFDLLKAGNSKDDAAKKSGLLDSLTAHKYDLANLAVGLAALFNKGAAAEW